jgi:hypothetical protein
VVPSPKFQAKEVALLDVLALKVHVRLEQDLVNRAVELTTAATVTS